MTSSFDRFATVTNYGNENPFEFAVWLAFLLRTLFLILIHHIRSLVVCTIASLALILFLLETGPVLKATLMLNVSV